MAGNEIAQRFGANFARARERAGISQEEVGFRASLHRTEVGQLERGVRLARIDTLVKLAGALAVPPGSLLDGMDWEPGGFAPGEFRLPPDADRACPK
jgi:transcriptional regulator with XRE-family HTH domain